MLTAAAQATIQAEEQARLRAYLPLQPAVALRSRLGPPAIFPLATLTWQHCLELAEAGNAFMVPGARPTRADYFGLLWRLNPYYRNAAGLWPNLPATDRRPGTFRTWLSRLVVRLAVAGLNFDAAEVPLRRHLLVAWQDRGARRRKSGRDDSSNLLELLTPINAFDDVVAHFTERGWSIAQCLACPVAVSFQLRRLQRIVSGHAEEHLPGGKVLQFEPELAKEATP